MDAARYHKIQDFIDSLRDEEVYQLYGQLAARISLIREHAEQLALNNFRPLERVYFHKNMRHIEGTIVQVNRRTVSVVTDGGERWTVAPQYLAKVAITPPPRSNANSKNYVEGTVVSRKKMSKKKKSK